MDDERDERRAQARYPRHRASVKAARTFARQIATEWKLDALVHDLVLVVSELVTNAIVHGTTAQGREVGLTFDLNPMRLRVEVRDPGDGTPAVREDSSDDDENGRGLHIVDATVDRWGVTPRVIGKTTWAEWKLDKANVPPAECIEVAPC
jgi:anti-sigma regulatory factor (Ser/Thr protein kinase)